MDAIVSRHAEGESLQGDHRLLHVKAVRPELDFLGEEVDPARYDVHDV